MFFTFLPTVQPRRAGTVLRPTNATVSATNSPWREPYDGRNDGCDAEAIPPEAKRFGHRSGGCGGGPS